MSTGEKRKRGEEGPAEEGELHELVRKAALGAKLMFINAYGAAVQEDKSSKKLGLAVKAKAYSSRAAQKAEIVKQNSQAAQAPSTKLLKGAPAGGEASAGDAVKTLPDPTHAGQLIVQGDKAKAEELKKQQEREARKNQSLVVLPMSGKELRAMHDKSQPKPVWHAPWKLHRVMPGHLGWVRSIAVDHTNEWFASAGVDRTVKIWNLATGELKVTLSGHTSAIRALAISARSPYMFTCGEDGKVMCWDLETNKVTRNYHGHLNGVYSLTLHPKLDILASGGRDASVRVWDIRTKAEIHCMTGHTGAVNALMCPPNSTIVSGSQDNQMRIWDIAEGRSVATLTHHKKGIRALAMHPQEYTFVSGAADNIKKWKCPRGEFLMNFSGHNAIVNTLSINHDNVMASGGEDGAIRFWDWKTGYNFQRMNTIAQPGSLESETAIYCSTFDHSGSRLITGEADKTIKIWKEDEAATPDTHPIDWKPERRKHF